MAKSFKDIKKDLEAKDPEFYNEIMTEANQEIEEIQTQWGGKRANSGRKKVFVIKIKKTFELEQSDVICLEQYAKAHNISKNKAIKEAIHKLQEALN
jgi:hypothetical protein